MAPRLLFITRKYPPARGGMEEFSLRLYEAYPGTKKLVALRRGQRWLPIFLAYSLFEAWWERRDVEHVHLGDGMLAPLAPVVRAIARAPVSVSVHGQEITRDFRGYRGVIGWGLRRADAVIAVSGFTAEEAAGIHGIRADVVTNGVDTERFAGIASTREATDVRAIAGIPAEGLLIVTVGRLVERKGVVWFIRNVLPRLDANVRYVVVGDGPYRAEVDAAASGDARVTVLGDVPAERVDALLGAADLFVAPNISVPGRPEGYGIAPAEAAAARVPVLVSDIEGLVDMARDTGVPTVRAGDAGAWATSVRRALAEPAWALAANPARSWEMVAADYARIFTGCVANFGRERRNRRIKASRT
ncbi:MAG TPA: glycosyltransferase family 4 protein [Tepidiformaceae bacterium]|nr:glycosyltransferase family 4 protein [Tepidiformaceae bacterium]